MGSNNSIKIEVEWIDVNDRLPDHDHDVLVSCECMGRRIGESATLIARYTMLEEWYAEFPYDQPVNPTHWMEYPKPAK